MWIPQGRKPINAAAGKSSRILEQDRRSWFLLQNKRISFVMAPSVLENKMYFMNNYHVLNWNKRLQIVEKSKFNSEVFDQENSLWSINWFILLKAGLSIVGPILRWILNSYFKFFSCLHTLRTLVPAYLLHKYIKCQCDSKPICVFGHEFAMIDA